MLVGFVHEDPTRPVFVLHDADPRGCLLVPRLRAALPPGARVLDAGLAPRMASGATPPVLRPPDAGALGELLAAGVPLSDGERAWLSGGRTVPLAAVRPAHLLRAVERTLARADRDTERAAAVDFLRWPEEAR